MFKSLNIYKGQIYLMVSNFMAKSTDLQMVKVQTSGPLNRKCFHKECILLYHMGLDMRKPNFGVSDQQRHRPDFASGQTDQRLCYSLFRKYHI